MMKFVIILLSLAATFSMAVERPQDFRWQAAIHTENAAPYYRITLPVDTYLRADKTYLQDIRIFNADGNVVPYARTRAEAQQVQRLKLEELPWFPIFHDKNAPHQADLQVRVQQDANGTLLELNSAGQNTAMARPQKIGYLLDASAVSQKDKAQALVLDWVSTQPSEGFQLLDVEVSDDLQNWQMLKRGAQLARLTFNGERIEQRRIELNSIAGRYLRLQWRDPVSAPELNRVQLEMDTAQWRSPPLAWSEPLKPQSAASLKLREGEYYYKLPRPIPANRLRITLPEGNVLAPMQIILPHGERRHWYSVAQGVVYRIGSQTQQWTQDEIALPARWMQDFIVRLDARSSRSVRDPRIELAVQPAQIIFLAEGKPPYNLAVGNENMNSAALPLDTLVPGMGRATAPHIADAQLAPLQTYSAAQKRASMSLNKQKWQTILLWGLLVAGVIAMAAMAWQLIRQMQKK